MCTDAVWACRRICHNSRFARNLSTFSSSGAVGYERVHWPSNLPRHLVKASPGTCLAFTSFCVDLWLMRNTISFIYFIFYSILLFLLNVEPHSWICPSPLFCPWLQVCSIPPFQVIPHPYLWSFLPPLTSSNQTLSWRLLCFLPSSLFLLIHSLACCVHLLPHC